MKWHRVLILTVRQAFRPVEGLNVTRCHLANTPDGVLMAQWDTPESEREYPKAKLVGWKPSRAVPFRFPVRFQRTDSPTLVTLIQREAWILPYDEDTFQHYHALALQLKAIDESLAQLYQQIDADPLTLAVIPFRFSS